MATPDREKIPLVLRRTERGLEPCSRLAADILAQYAVHSDVEITIKKRRSLPQLKAYWAMLQDVVDATGSHPDAEHLHEALKMALGYTMPVKKLSGEIEFIPDSVAIARMDAAQFKAFFDRAAAKLAEVYGYAPNFGEAA